jgi:hypothetical protein
MSDETISPLQNIMQQLVDLSRRESYCDITFHNAPPLIGVRLSPALNAALMYGAGAAKISELLGRVETRHGAVFSAMDVWVIVQFPDGLPSAEDLASVDLSDGEAEVLPGKSMRLMAKEIYHCKDDIEAEAMLRRVLAA